MTSGYPLRRSPARVDALAAQLITLNARRQLDKLTLVIILINRTLLSLTRAVVCLSCCTVGSNCPITWAVDGSMTVLAHANQLPLPRL